MPLLKRLLRSRILIGLMVLFVAWALFLILFYLVESSAQPDFRPVKDPVPASFLEAEKGIPNYQRPIESTYLTFPEWYLVFNPQEYGKFIEVDRPSRFPYFTSIAQFWGSYGRFYGLTKRNYPSDIGDNLMEAIIGTSFSVEYIVKGLWENSIGRILEWISGCEKTQEDLYAAKAAQDYGAFVPTDPWFEFPFGKKLVGLWTETPFFGPHFLRKCERKTFLSLEYGGKALYALPIKLASHMVYGVADTEVFLAVQHAPKGIFKDPKVRRLKDLGKGSYLIALPHYQGFTDTLPELTAKGLEIVDIAGNREILVSAVGTKERNYQPKEATLLFTMNMMADSHRQRLLLQVPTRALRKVLGEFKAQDITLEHLFDY